MLAEDVAMGPRSARGEILTHQTHGLSTGTSECWQLRPRHAGTPFCNRLGHLSSLTENSDMVMYSLKRTESFEGPSPLSELIAQYF